YIKAPRDNTPLRIASGAHDQDYYWTEILLSQASKYMDGFSLHYYTFPGGRWESKGPSTAFPEDQWASTLQYALRIDELITKHSAIMDKYDAPKRIALFVDEWGTWYDTEPGQNPGFLYQQNTLRDALVAAVTLDILHRHADRVRMSSVAQMVNVLQAMILTDKEKMILTPTYHVFDMYVPFQDATFLPTEVTTPQYKRADFAMPAVHTSAARGTDGRLHLSLVNLDPHQAVSVSVRITGASGRGATGRILTGSAMDAKNTFDQPNALQPQPFKGTRKGDTLVFAMPAKSVAVVAVDE
ncbi:MAG: alpha-L-arabinofuranosidase C-terminal domain-containing protein, partial [Povalibacter sp.]